MPGRERGSPRRSTARRAERNGQAVPLREDRARPGLVARRRVPAAAGQRQGALDADRSDRHVAVYRGRGWSDDRRVPRAARHADPDAGPRDLYAVHAIQSAGPADRAAPDDYGGPDAGIPPRLRENLWG